MNKGKTIDLELRLLVLAIAAATPTAQAASEFGLDVGLGVEHYSNAARTPTNEKSDVARVGSVDVTWANKDSAVHGDVGYHAERRDFVDDLQNDETAVNGRASLLWDAAPRVFDVIVQHQIETTQTTAQGADVSGNRERRSVLTGGVDGYLHLSSVDTIAIRPRYTDIKFSRSDGSDSQRKGTDIDWQHRSSAVSIFGIATNYTQVEFDQTGMDYNQTSAEVNYSTQLARLSYTLAGGYNWIDRDQLEDVSGYQARIAATYKGEGFDVGGSAIRQLTDSSVGLSGETFAIDNFTPADTNFQQPDVVERTQIDFNADWQWTAVTTLSAGVGLSRDDYKVTPQDRERRYAVVGISHALNTYWRLMGDARVTKERNLDSLIPADYSDVVLTVGALCQFNPRMALHLSVSRVDRSADNAAQEYTDVVSLVSFTYKFF